MTMIGVVFFKIMNENYFNDFDAITRFQAYQAQRRYKKLFLFCKKVVFRNFTKFTGKHLRQSLFSNKVAGLRLPLNSFFLNQEGFLFTYFI